MIRSSETKERLIRSRIYRRNGVGLRSVCNVWGSLECYGLLVTRMYLLAWPIAVNLSRGRRRICWLTKKHLCGDRRGNNME